MRNYSEGSLAVPTIKLIAPSDVSAFNEAELRSCLFALERVEQQASALRVRIAQRSAELHKAGGRERPEDLLSRSGQTPKNEIRQTIKAAETISQTPELSAQLEQIPTANLKTTVATISRLSDDEKDRLDMGLVAKVATKEDVSSFGAKLRTHITDTAVSKAEQHLRARKRSEFKHWMNKDQGMGQGFLQYDPERYEVFAKIIDKGVSILANSGLKNGQNISGAKIRKDHNLAAEALFQIVAGKLDPTNSAVDVSGYSSGPRSDLVANSRQTKLTTDKKQEANANEKQATTRSRRPVCNGHCTQETKLSPTAEVLVVVDSETLRVGEHPETVCETENGNPISPESLERHLCNAVYRKVTLDESKVPINVGRRYRTATDAQWSAIKAMYSTCAFDGCETRIGWCQPHHIQYWRHDGKTDLGNLVPLCSEHHHLVHEGGWKIALTPKRQLKIFDREAVLISVTDSPIRGPAKIDSG